MTKHRIVIFVLLTVAIAVSILFVRLPQVLEYIAVTELESLGATNISVDVADIGLHRAKINQLTFVLERDAQRFTISTHDIKLSYSLSEILTGELASVNVSEVSMLVELLPSSDTESSAHRNIPLPAELLASIPVESVNIEQINLEVLANDERFPDIKAKGELMLNASSVDVRLDIQTDAYGLQRVDLELMPTGTSRLVLSDVQIHSEPTTYFELSSGAWTSTDEQLQANVAINVDVKKLQTQLERWGIHLLPKGASGMLTMQGPLIMSVKDRPSWQAEGKLSLQLPEFERVVKGLSLNTPIKFALNPKQLGLYLGKGGQISIKKIKLAEAQFKSVLAKLATQAACDYQFAKNNWSCKPFALELNIPSVRHKQTNITTSSGRIELTSLAGQLQTWSANLGIDIPAWVIDIGEGEVTQQINLEKVNGTIDASNKKIHAKLSLAAPNRGATLHVDATHVMKNKSGRAQYRLEPIDMQQHSNVFANTYSDWPAKLSLNTGVVGLMGEMAWKNNDVLPKAHATLSIQDVGGMHDEISFAGLNGTLDMSAIKNIVIRTREKLHLKNLDIGAPITDMALQAELHLPNKGKPKMIVSEVSMNTLGGKVYGKQIEIDLNREQNPFTLQVSGLDIEELLKLEQKQGVFGTGVVDGELPLLLTRDGISMQQGYLGARKPGGKLRYSANEGMRSMAKTNAGVKILVIAMQDFSYKVLEAVVDYTPDGLLKLKVRIEGSNPELEGGRPVHLNVNVENNILDLLRSLRLANDISDKISEQVQNQ